MSEFPCDGPISVAIRVGGGTVTVTAEERSSAAVEVEPFDSSDAALEAAETTRVTLEGDTLIIATPEVFGGWLWRRSARVRVSVRVPLDSSLTAKLGSADLRAYGRFGSANLKLASGDAFFQHAIGSLGVSTASGDLTIERVDGAIDLRSASGDVEVSHAGGDLVAHSASGDLRIGRAGASVQLVSASGDIAIAEARTGVVRVRSASGDVSVGVAPGTGVWLDLGTASGTARNDLPAPSDADAAEHRSDDVQLRIEVRTMSGDVRVRRSSLPSELPTLA